MDPLSVLREFTIRGEDLDRIERVGDEYRFGSECSFPCAAETAYRSKSGSLYTLEALVHYVKNQHLKHGEYMQSTVKNAVPAVTLLDRKPLLDYLTGRVASSDSIDFLLLQQQNAQSQKKNEEYRPDQDNSAFVSRENAIEDMEVEDFGKPGEDVDYVMLIRSNERPLKSREAILECKNRDFYSVLVNSTKREEERQRIESQQRKDGLVAKSRLMGAEERGVVGFGGSGDNSGFDANPKPKLHLKSGKIGEGVPIILVPSAFQTLITIYNVKEFLEDGVFIPTDVKAKQMKGPKPDCITVQKKFSRDRERVVTAYEVRDKPSALKQDDWDRVVAVFVLGKEWQFKDWPFKDHVEIFNKVLGFFLRFEDDSIESAKTAKQWNVKIISISKNKRHQDRAAALEVWEKLEEFVRSRSRS
ncbi:PREDICTED: protein CDC73 homolog [Tarenaya hassleriana]|uniref:protein CDC73 homolog n=1 Tax=Tarenaya hassleriana TaxID=28532 RepID=UPI00053C0A23|nr:PREDICTED: protein CDC73 homolog [Tarenaya hassleriana]XP_010551718.1 PREDICTED: protein CDC73 homolog [Tarenaya hassleriana]